MQLYVFTFLGDMVFQRNKKEDLKQLMKEGNEIRRILNGIELKNRETGK